MLIKFRFFFPVVFSIVATSLSASQSNEQPEPSSAKEKEIINKFIKIASEPGGSFFSPPEGWMFSDLDNLPPRVKFMVVGKGKSLFRPSINLATEKYSGTVNDYLKVVKNINNTKGDSWKNLGTIDTLAGPASLSQAETTTKWGEVRMMHLIASHKGVIHIMTAAALKEEFSQFYPEFFRAMQSFRFNKSAIEMVAEPSRRTMLEDTCSKLKNDRKTMNIDAFRKDSWVPFKTTITEQFADMGEEWEQALFMDLEEELFNDFNTSS